MSDNVNHPKHYADTTSIECIEAMTVAFGRGAVVDFCKCNAFKYVWRYKNKNGKEDLEKAQWYCNKAVELYGTSGCEYEDEQLDALIRLIDSKGGEKIGNEKVL